MFAVSVHEVVANIDGKQHSRKIEIQVDGDKGKRIISEDGKIKQESAMSPEEVAYFLNHDTLHGHGFRAQPFVIADKAQEQKSKKKTSKNMKRESKSSHKLTAPEAKHDGVVEISNEQDLGRLLAAHKTVFLLFYSPTCGHCQIFKPVWDEVAARLSKSKKNKPLVFAQVSVGLNWENPMIQKYNIDGVPMVLKFTVSDGAKHNIEIMNVSTSQTANGFEQNVKESL